MTALLLVALAALPHLQQDATSSVAERPRVGLVLSSGGAHSLAQVGALEALEELHIPVDFIAGSEGGALIGGLYAAGNSSSEIRDLLQDRVWLDALTGRIPRTLLSWRQRTVDRDFLFAMPVSFGPGHLGLARGLARSRWISWLLACATIRAAGTRDFDEMPIPLRVVATDPLAGERVVLDAGDLSAAILASIATPGLYAPVEIGGRELTSGALLDPIPIDSALSAGCDVLIVVDCSLVLDRPERLGSFMEAAAHVRVLSAESARREGLARLRPSDIVVRPDVGDVGEEDFRSALGAIDSGRDAILKRAESLAALALLDVVRSK